MARYYPESSEAKRQLATSRANYGLVLRLTGDPGAEAMIRAAEADAAAIGEAGAGILQALQRNSSNSGQSAPPPGRAPSASRTSATPRSKPAAATASAASACGPGSRSNGARRAASALNFAAAPGASTSVRHRRRTKHTHPLTPNISPHTPESRRRATCPCSGAHHNQHPRTWNRERGSQPRTTATACSSPSRRASGPPPFPPGDLDHPQNVLAAP